MLLLLLLLLLLHLMLLHLLLLLLLPVSSWQAEPDQVAARNRRA
jgi:hypothetical protein